MRIALFALLFMLLRLHALPAEEYPFADLPKIMTATLNVNTQKREAVNNSLLGYNILHFSKKKGRDLIRKFDPVAVRFSDGAWGNFYDWETDSYTNYGEMNPRDKRFAKTLEVWRKLGIKGGFPGLTLLNTEKKKRSGQGYDVVWLYNAAFDSPAKNVSRMKDSLSKGLAVCDIELGNEQFWKSQTSKQTRTPEGYLEAARSIASALKKARPGVRVSIPLSWRETHSHYNKTVVGDAKYFDAIVLHKYIGADPDRAEESNTAFEEVLTARLSMAKAENYVQSFAPGKPIWLTEWGVSAGKEGPSAKAAAALGMADCYLYLFENQNIYHRAHWFSVNGLCNSFLIFKEKRKLLYPLQKTAYASVFEIVRSVFEDGQLLHSQVTTSKLKTKTGKIDAISARGVAKEGKVAIIAVNLTDKPCRFTLKFEGRSYNQPVVHEAMSFKSLSETIVLPFEQSPLRRIQNKMGAILLPPLSVNKLTGIKDVKGSKRINADGDSAAGYPWR